MTEITPNTPETTEVSSRDQAQWATQSPKTTLVYSKSTLIAGVVLLVVLTITGFLYAQVTSLESERSAIVTAIANEQAAIDVLKAKPELRATELFRNNKTVLAKAIDTSNAATYIRELERIQAEDNNLILSGFNYGGGKITTSATSLKGTYDDAVKRIIPLIRGYRDGSANSASGSLAKFDLKQIQSVSGKSDKRSINLEFSVQ
jgi:Tfp pilus assembly protein PilX